MQPEKFMNISYKFDRRRYGHGKTTKFFTWLMFRTPFTPDHEWETYGDPWPKVKLNKKELDEALHNIVSSFLRIGNRIRLNTGAEAQVVSKQGYNLGIVVHGLSDVVVIPSTAFYEVL